LLTRLLIAINVIAFVWQFTTGGFGTDALIAHGGIVSGLVLQGQWWRIVSSAFLHGSIIHILFNMFALYQVGLFIEALYGTARMAVIYGLAMIGAGLSVTFFGQHDIVTIGASGPIFGLFGALAIAGMRLGERGKQLMQQAIGVIVLNLALTLFIPNISVAAHIGGLITGAIFGFLLFRVPRPQPQPVAVARQIDGSADRGAVTIDQPPA
jgi:rhomboid protease GluP